MQLWAVFHRSRGQTESMLVCANSGQQFLLLLLLTSLPFSLYSCVVYRGCASSPELEAKFTSIQVAKFIWKALITAEGSANVMPNVCTCTLGCFPSLCALYI